MHEWKLIDKNHIIFNLLWIVKTILGLKEENKWGTVKRMKALSII